MKIPGNWSRAFLALGMAFAAGEAMAELEPEPIPNVLTLPTPSSLPMASKATR